jgi:hypothetical protein
VTVAEQLHYTSAATGLAGRPGFQFVAASPGATPVMQQAVAPYLTYRPPPSAPSQPTAAQLAAFPVSFSYLPDGEQAILTQCRYLGTDYSGRYGNFLGHAIVADLAELPDQPPIALWRSPVWATEPADSLKSLADHGLRDLVGPPARTQPHSQLGGLLEAVLATLDGRAGQVFLVADDVETVVGGIAAVSYALPPAWARRLSFVTYTGDPDRARQHLVGTTADAWRGGAGHGQVFRLDQPAAAGMPAGRYASALAAAWARQDRYEVDALNELVTAVAQDPAERDAAAALASLCRGEPVGGSDAARVAALLDRRADRLPGWVWEDLDSRAGEQLGLELALAVHRAAGRAGHPALAEQAAAVAVRLAIGAPADRPRLAQVHLSPSTAAGLTGAVDAALRGAADLDDLVAVVREAQRLGVAVPAGGLHAGTAHAAAAGRGRVEPLLAAAPDRPLRSAVLAGLVDGLAHAPPALLGAVLTDEVCDALGRRDWEPSPRVGAHVLASRGRRFPAEREEVTTVLAGLADRDLLADPELGRRLREIWDAGASERSSEASDAAGFAAAPSIAICLRLLDGLDSAERVRRRGVVALARRAFAAGDLTGVEAFGLAERLHHLLGTADPAVADAGAVRALQLARAGRPGGYAMLASVQGLAAREVFRRAVANAIAAFAAAKPQQQAQALYELPSGGELRRHLRGVLTNRVAEGARGSALNLAEVAIRLWRAGAPDSRLTTQVARVASRPPAARTLRDGLRRRDPQLLADLQQLLDDHYQRSRAGHGPGRGLRRFLGLG